MREAHSRYLGFTVIVLAAFVSAAPTGGSCTPAPTPAQTKVVAANDLGMHCVDKEFSVFSILPPYNVVQAQVVQTASTGLPRVLTDADVRVTYGAVADAGGSINTTSKNKTGFWSFAQALFGATLQPGQGLQGLYMPADAPVPGPQALRFDAATTFFRADGIPIIPTDDASRYNPYPLLRITAIDKATNTELAHTDIVVPVSTETDCQNCHATGGIAADDPTIPWSHDPDLEKQSKLNILTLHDHAEGTSLIASQPVLCAGCHYSAALDLAGAGPQGPQIGKPTSSAVAHDFHGRQLDANGNKVFPSNGDALSTCYQCHPGRITQCDRGAMKTAGLECRDCHGDMLSVGGAYPLAVGGSMDGANDGGHRRPWLDMPRCQSCHTGDALNHLSGAGLVMAPDGIRLDQAYRTGDAAASSILASNTRFAEDTHTRFRFSTGHGDVLCEGCHGSTHAIWPNADAAANDNVAAQQIQGHSGTLIECTACHASGTVPLNLNGPHGMHVVGDSRWIDEDAHGQLFENNKNSCRTCHGASLQGTPLSKAAATRTFNVEDRGVVTIAAGTQVRCNHCHSTPG